MILIYFKIFILKLKLKFFSKFSFLFFILILNPNYFSISQYFAKLYDE